MSEQKLPAPAEVTLSGKTYLLTPLPKKDVVHMFFLIRRLVKLELGKLGLTVQTNPILRTAAEQYVLACLLPLNENFDRCILCTVSKEEMLHALGVAVALSGRMLKLGGL